MNRYFISHERIQTSEGRLPVEMFIATNDAVSGWGYLVDPPQLNPIQDPIGRFIKGLQRGEDCGLYVVSSDTYEENLRLWNMAIQTAKTPPARRSRSTATTVTDPQT